MAAMPATHCTGSNPRPHVNGLAGPPIPTPLRNPGIRILPSRGSWMVRPSTCARIAAATQPGTFHIFKILRIQRWDNISKALAWSKRKAARALAKSPSRGP